MHYVMHHVMRCVMHYVMATSGRSTSLGTPMKASATCATSRGSTCVFSLQGNRGGCSLPRTRLQLGCTAYHAQGWSLSRTGSQHHLPPHGTDLLHLLHLLHLLLRLLLTGAYGTTRGYLLLAAYHSSSSTEWSIRVRPIRYLQCTRLLQ